MSKNIFVSKGKVNRVMREELLDQRAAVLWFTGLSGSGKSTLSSMLEKQLIDIRKICYRLDGDNIRKGINSDLGFTDDERRENIRRVAHIASLFYDAGIIVLVSFISPHRDMRKFAKSLIPKNFFEIYIKCDIETCKLRDPKGLYKKALKGEIANFTGISSSYEEPDQPDLTIQTDKLSPEQSVKIIMDFLKTKNLV